MVRVRARDKGRVGVRVWASRWFGRLGGVREWIRVRVRRKIRSSAIDENCRHVLFLSWFCLGFVVLSCLVLSCACLVLTLYLSCTCLVVALCCLVLCCLVLSCACFVPRVRVIMMAENRARSFWLCTFLVEREVLE